MFGPSTTNNNSYPNPRASLDRFSTVNNYFNTTSNPIEIEDDNKIQQNTSSNGEDLPLKGLVVYVEIFTNGANISETSFSYLNNLGAKVEKRLTKKCNLVIWKDGSMKTIEKAKQNKASVVNSLWLENCIENFHCASFDKYAPEITSDMAFAKNPPKKQTNKRKAQDTFTPQTFMETLPQTEENKNFTPFKRTKVTPAEVENGNKPTGGLFNYNYSQSLPLWEASKEADFERFTYNKPEKRRVSSSSQRIEDLSKKSVSKIDYSQPVSLKKSYTCSGFKDDSCKMETLLEKYADKNLFLGSNRKSMSQCISSGKDSKNKIYSSEFWRQENGIQGFNNEEEFVENNGKQQEEIFDSWTCIEVNKKEEFTKKDVSVREVKVSQKKEQGKSSARKVNKKPSNSQRSPVMSPRMSLKNTQDTEDEAEIEETENGVLFMNILKEDIDKCKVFCEKFGFVYLEDTIMNASKSQYIVCPEGRLPRNYKTAFGMLKDRPVINLNWVKKSQERGKLQDFWSYEFEQNKETCKELFKETRFFIEKEFESLPKNMVRKKELSILIEGTGGEVTENFRNCDFYVTRRPSEVKKSLPAHVKMIMSQVIIDSICTGKRPNLKN